uniref:Uncharacterized protein n=1 Tax=Magallana gigas TaxID=29159 RepID=A0A8W8MKN2_MAGGI
MSDLLRPENFDNVAKGALITASPGFDDEEDLQAPSTAIRLGYEIKRMLSAKWAKGIKSKDEAAANDSKSFLKLMEFEWSTKVTKLATVTLQVRSFNKEKSLPEPEDINKIQEKIRNDIKTFDEKDTTAQNFRFAAEVKDYVRRQQSVTNVERSMRAELTVLEQKLLESQDLLEVRGKLGRGVPVIVPNDTKRILKYLASADVRVKAGIQPSNDFLFSNPRFGVLRAYDSLKAFCDKCCLKKPEKITSVNLRKYTATIAQVFDISPQQQQWLTNHLGHTLDIHKIHYRQTSGIIERVDISKLMLLTEYGLTGKYAGKKLTDITLEGNDVEFFKCFGVLFSTHQILKGIAITRDTTFKVKFNDQWRGDKLIDIYDKLHGMFDDVLSQARGHDADLGRVVLSHLNLNNSIVVPLQSWEKLNADTVMSEITKVLNSNETIPVDEHLLVTVGSIDLPKGGSWSGNKLPVTSLFGPNNSLHKKKSVLYVENDNNLCLPIAIGLCFMKTCKKVNAETWSRLTGNDSCATMQHVIEHRTVPKHYYGNLLKKSRRKYQTDMAIWLCNKAGVPFDRYLGLNYIEPFETLLNVNINVVSSRVGNKFVRVAKEDTERISLYLYHVETENEKHWHGIGNIQGFFNAAYFCHTCLKPYKTKSAHSCATSCDVCLHDNCSESELQVGCLSCGRVCRSLACFERHKVGKMVHKNKVPPACELWYQCKKCRVKLATAKRNPQLHVCGEWQCSSCSKYHVGTHLCYQKAYNTDPEKAEKKFIFYDFETRQDDIFECDQGYTPSCIRCRECAKKDRQCASCRLCLNCKDPSCGLHLHTVNFTGLYGVNVRPDGTISTTIKDGVDPFDYVTIASVCMGIYKTLFLKHNTEVEITKDQTSTWHALDKFEGVQGVRLDEDWIALSDLEKEENTEVGKQRLTSPIAVVPSQGYVSKDNYSKISIQWLEWIMQRSRQRGTPVHIRHALNGGEYHVPDTNYRCDGFAENPQGKDTIYELYGCVYHGCPDCFQQDRSDVKHPATNQTLDELFKMTKKRERELKERGYRLVVRKELL